MEVKILPVGGLGTNCYVLLDEETKQAAVIDPGDEAGRILFLLRQTGAEVRYILLTHGHYDHTTAVPELHEALPDADIYIHQGDANKGGGPLFPLAGQMDDLKLYDEGDTLPLGSLTIHVLHTPGHSRGSVVLRVEDVLFTGDTLFAGSCGRTDLPGGDFAQICDSLARLGRLEGEFHVLPGHGELSQMSRERDYNSYMIQAMGRK